MVNITVIPYIKRYIGKIFVIVYRKSRNACAARLRADNKADNKRDTVLNCYRPIYAGRIGRTYKTPTNYTDGGNTKNEFC